MRIVKRLLTIVLVLFVILMLAAGGAGVYLVRKDLPQIDGTVKAAGLRAQVDVIRDQYGVPHIYAQNEHDLFFAEGYVHAQDRFWQMEFWRRIGQGRLSEILGASGLSTDRYIRTVGFNRVAEAEYAGLTPDERASLQAYADGVNAYLETHKGNFGLEFTLLGVNGVSFDPEPWTPINSITWIKLMAQDLGGNMDTELLRMRMIQAIGAEKTAEILPATYPSDKPVILPSAARFDGLETAQLVRDLASYRNLAGSLGDGLGSNNWVVAGSHTTTGKPLLANDPHLGIRMPSIWYEVDLHCVQLAADCRYQAAGFSFPGDPGIVLGHNQRIAWGFTNVGPDVQDLYIEDVQGDAVRFKGELVPLQTVEEPILVTGKLPADYWAAPNETSAYDAASDRTTVTLRVRIVPHHGPVISDSSKALGGAGKVLSLHWPTLEPGHMVGFVLQLNRAQNWDEFRAALALFQAPSQNIVYGDVDGHIGWQVPGDIPIRAPGCDGLTPAPGDGTCEWQGYVPYDDLPRSYDPARGWIATANNAPVGADYPYVLGREWDDGYRAERIVQMLAAKDKFSPDDLAAMQMDTQNLYAGEIIPLLSDLQVTDPRAQQALDRLRGWNLAAARDSVGETIFASLNLQLLRNIFGDELGSDLAPEYYDNASFNRGALKAVLADPASPWWDDVKTAGQVETRAQILERSLRATVDELTGKLGGDMAGWTWGKVHTATFENETLGQSDALFGGIKWLLNRGPFPVDGGPGIVDATSWSPRNPYVVVSVPSMRAIYDLGDLTASRTIHTTGQSGHPFHTHYYDFVDPWVNGQYHPQLFDRAAVEAAREGHLVLTP